MEGGRVVKRERERERERERQGYVVNSVQGEYTAERQ
jgi:hypothetical protein